MSGSGSYYIDSESEMIFQEIYESIHIETIQDILYQINDILKEKIPTLSIDFNTYDLMIQGKDIKDFDIYDKSKKPALLLCLLHNGKCISSISCKINTKDNAIEISSKTNEKYQGKKYNLFLRYAIILIIIHLEYRDKEQFQQIISRAINPISIFSMTKHFNASNEKLEEYIKKNDLKPPNELTLDEVTNFYEDLRKIPDDIEDEDAIMEYYEQNIEPYDPVILEINLKQDPEIIEEYLNRIKQVEIKLPPEDTSESSKGGKKSRRRKIKGRKLKTKKNKLYL